MTGGTRGRALTLVLALLLSVVPRPAPAASRVLPGLAFRVVRTAHFRIYFHRGAERQARELAVVAEAVWEHLPATLGLSPPRLTHVLLVDQDDEANGWATPLPYDTVMVTSAWPAPSEIIGNTRDWLRVVFSHEFTHVLQLHQSRGWARAARAVFGRVPFAFPNLFLPRWEVEGLATFAETRYTGEGRLRAGDSASLVRERVAELGPQRIDSVAGGQVDWPAGLGPYLDGGFFIDYLAARFGEEKLGEVALRSAGRLPFLAAPVFQATYGEGLADLWKDFQQSMRANGFLGAPARATPGNVPATPRPERMTRRGFYVTTPRFASDGGLVFGVRDADDLPALVKRDGRGERRLTARFGGEQVSVRGSVIYFDSADYAASVAWQSDLYAYDVATGRTQRLTRHARLVAPDISPDGRSLVCVRTSGGGRRLALFRVDGDVVGRLRLVEVPAPRDDTGIYGSPRWAPDGRRLAAERRETGGASQIVIVNPSAGQRRVAAQSRTARVIAPTWAPDGTSIVFASDGDGPSFQLYVADSRGARHSSSARTVDAAGYEGSAGAEGEGGQPDVRRLGPDVPGGAMSPVISPDGRRLVYVGYTAAGYDLFEIDFDAPRTESAVPLDASDVRLQADATGATREATREAGGTSVAGRTDDAGDSSAPYTPLSTLLPRYWQPAGDIVGNHVRLGASTSGVDLLGRHAFGVTALWRLEAGTYGANGAHRARPDSSAYYVYDRWRASFFASGSDETNWVAQYAGGIRMGDAERRVTKLSFGTSVPLVGARHSQIVIATYNVERSRLAMMRGVRSYLRNSLQTGWAFSSAHLFGRSISPEQGISVAVTSEQVRRGFGADGNADAFTGELRGYLRLGGRHGVLAGRAALGAANGDARVARTFYLGGPDPARSLIDFGTGAFSLLRGFPADAFGASHVGVANLEYRFPVWRIDRGKGTWPVFLRTLHAAVFADAGKVWDHHFSWAGPKVAVGAELSLDAVLGFEMPLTLSAGFGRPAGADGGRGPLAYVRIGRAF
jgi:Tol biopolymer transport system component